MFTQPMFMQPLLADSSAQDIKLSVLNASVAAPQQRGVVYVGGVLCDDKQGRDRQNVLNKFAQLILEQKDNKEEEKTQEAARQPIVTWLASAIDNQRKQHTITGFTLMSRNSYLTVTPEKKLCCVTRAIYQKNPLRQYSLFDVPADDTNHHSEQGDIELVTTTLSDENYQNNTSQAKVIVLKAHLDNAINQSMFQNIANNITVERFIHPLARIKKIIQEDQYLRQAGDDSERISQTYSIVTLIYLIDKICQLEFSIKQLASDQSALIKSYCEEAERRGYRSKKLVIKKSNNFTIGAYVPCQKLFDVLAESNKLDFTYNNPDMPRLGQASEQVLSAIKIKAQESAHDYPIQLAQQAIKESGSLSNLLSFFLKIKDRASSIDDKDSPMRATNEINAFLSCVKWIESNPLNQINYYSLKNKILIAVLLSALGSAINYFSHGGIHGLIQQHLSQEQIASTDVITMTAVHGFLLLIQPFLLFKSFNLVYPLISAIINFILFFGASFFVQQESIAANALTSGVIASILLICQCLLPQPLAITHFDENYFIIPNKKSQFIPVEKKEIEYYSSDQLAKIFFYEFYSFGENSQLVKYIYSSEMLMKRMLYFQDNLGITQDKVDDTVVKLINPKKLAKWLVESKHDQKYKNIVLNNNQKVHELACYVIFVKKNRENISSEDQFLAEKLENIAVIQEAITVSHNEEKNNPLV